MGKTKFDRRAPIIDMKGKLKRTGLSLTRIGRNWNVKKIRK